MTMTPKKTTVGINCKRMREGAGLTTRELATLAGVSSVRAIENGQSRNPTMETLEALAKALDVQVDALTKTHQAYRSMIHRVVRRMPWLVGR